MPTLKILKITLNRIMDCTYRDRLHFSKRALIFIELAPFSKKMDEALYVVELRLMSGPMQTFTELPVLKYEGPARKS